MSSGGGGSTSKQVTEIKQQPPTIVQDYYSPEFLERLANIGNLYQKRAMESRATSQDVTNRILAQYGKPAMFDPLIRSDTGTRVDPNLVTPINALDIIPKDPAFFRAPGAVSTDEKQQYENRINQLQSDLSKEQERSKYNQGMQRVRVPNPKFGSGWSYGTMYSRDSDN